MSSTRRTPSSRRRSSSTSDDCRPAQSLRQRKESPMRKWILLLIACAAITPAAAGHGDKGDWEFGPYGGFGWLDDYESLHPDNGALYGGRVGYFICPSLSVEASGQRLSSESVF